MAKKVIVFGGSGLVGSNFISLNSNNFHILAPNHSEIDLLDKKRTQKYIADNDPEVVLNFVGYANVDGSEREKDNTEGLAFKLNVVVPKNLAEVCKYLGKHLIHISTDYVFDGTKVNSPYTEEDKPNPINWYGKTKWLGEEAIEEIGGSYLIVRPEMPYRAYFPKKNDFARFFYESLRTGQQVKAVEDQKITPVFCDELSEALRLVIDSPIKGIIHLVSADFTSPYQFAMELAELFGFNNRLIIPVKFQKFNATRTAPRPNHTWLSIKRFEELYGKGILKPVKKSLEEFKRQINS